MWRAHIVEGKDILAQLVPKLHSDLGRTIGIMLWMCKPLFYTLKAVVVDSGFFVSKLIVTLALKGVYVRVIINKRRH